MSWTLATMTWWRTDRDLMRSSERRVGSGWVESVTMTMRLRRRVTVRARAKSLGTSECGEDRVMSSSMRRMIVSAWAFPDRAGMKRTRSASPATRPIWSPRATLSQAIASHAVRAISSLVSPDGARAPISRPVSTTSMTCRFAVASCLLMTGEPVRAVAAQSISRTSSPG